MTVMLLQNNVCVYNNNNNVSKSGPSTIEDQFREQVNKNETSTNEGRPRLNVFSLPHSGKTAFYCHFTLKFFFLHLLSSGYPAY